MTDKEFIKLCKKASELAHEHACLIMILEEEYKTRFGDYPSDVDDDFWIDSMHQGQTNFALADIVQSAKIHQR